MEHPIPLLASGCRFTGKAVMKKIWLPYALSALLAMNTFGQTEHPFLNKFLENRKAGGSALAGQTGSSVSNRMTDLRREIATAERLANDVKSLAKDSPWQRTPFVCYVVPAISAVRRLPDTLPPDGSLEARINMFAAQGEFEPGVICDRTAGGYGQAGGEGLAPGWPPGRHFRRYHRHQGGEMLVAARDCLDQLFRRSDPPRTDSGTCC